MNDHGRVVRSVNAFHQFVSCGLERCQRTVADAVQRPLNVARGQRASVVKMDSLAQMENISLGIGNLPLLRHPWLHVEVLVAMDQRIEDQLVNAL